MKTSAKYFRLAVGPGNMSQNGQNPTSLMTTLTKNVKPQSQNFFCCRL